MLIFQSSASLPMLSCEELLKRFPDATPAVKASLREPGKFGRQPIIATYERNGEPRERLLLRRESDGKLFDYRYMPKGNPPAIGDQPAWVAQAAWEASLAKAGCSGFRYQDAFSGSSQSSTGAPMGGKEGRPPFLSERFIPPLSGLVPRKLLPGGAIRKIEPRNTPGMESAFTGKYGEESKNSAMPHSLIKRFPDAPESVRSLQDGHSYEIAKYTNPKGERHERLLVRNSEGKLFDYRMPKGRAPPLFSYKDAWRTEEGWKKALGCKEISFSTPGSEETAPQQKQKTTASSNAEKQPSMVESKPAEKTAKEKKEEEFRREVQGQLSAGEFSLIEKYSEMYGLDLGVSLAVIYKESRFIVKPPPTSKTAERHYGLGQLSPTTAAEIKGKNGKYIFEFKHFRAIKKEREERNRKNGENGGAEMSLSDFSEKDLKELLEPEKNIHASLSYLSSRVEKFGLALGLEAYFQGDAPVKKHIANPEKSKLKTGYSKEALGLVPIFNDTIIPIYRGE